MWPSFSWALYGGCRTQACLLSVSEWTVLGQPPAWSTLILGPPRLPTCSRGPISAQFQAESHSQALCPHIPPPPPQVFQGQGGFRALLAGWAPGP